MELKLFFFIFRYLISVSNVQFDGHGERVIQSIIFDFQDFFVLAGFNQPHLFRQFLTQFFCPYRSDCCNRTLNSCSFLLFPMALEMAVPKAIHTLSEGRISLKFGLPGGGIQIEEIHPLLFNLFDH